MSDNQRLMWVEVYHPFNESTQLRVHTVDVSRGDARDQLSPGLIALHEVQARNKKEAVVNVILGKGRKVLG
jgi:hypothetical protein